jgi:hypothetical protein
LTELSYRDVTAAGISLSGPAVLPDSHGIKTVMYKSKTATSTPPVGIAAVWPSGCITAPYYGKLTSDQIFTPSTSQVGGPATVSNSTANPAGNGGSSTST